MAKLLIDCPFDVGDDVWVAKHAIERTTDDSDSTSRDQLALGKVVNIKREIDAATGEKQTRVKIRLSGGVEIKVKETAWDTTIFTRKNVVRVAVESEECQDPFVSDI